ncbi:DUF3006 family protein [Halobacterium zhouii]|uniref:DUF3006 family protein n=1 Tax=Halobacterium zhouii TaxID=2902624 RepID=UPI001E410B6E|nr:DUF3006 family protein [Halobacterium zhouii]
MTLPDGPYVGVVDRFEDGQAVLKLERDGTEVAAVSIREERLPARADRRHAIVRIVLRDGDVAAVWYDSRATRNRGASAQARLDGARSGDRREAAEEGSDAGGTAEGTGEERAAEEETGEERVDEDGTNGDG